MDNSSFPRIMEFKNKGLPEAQLLRLKDWFSKYQFKVQHIKGKSNTIPDLLSRPPKPPEAQTKAQTHSVHLLTKTKSIPLILMFDPVTQYPEIPEYPTQAPRFNNTHEIYVWAKNHIFYYQVKMILGAGHPIDQCKFFPDYVFLPLMRYEQPSLSWNGYWYHWCLGVTCWYALEINLQNLISAMTYTPLNPNICHIKKFNLLNLIYGYWNRREWISYLEKRVRTFYANYEETETPYITLILNRPYCIRDENTFDSFIATAYCYEYCMTSGGLDEDKRVSLFKYLCEKNRVNPDPWKDFTASQQVFADDIIEDEYFCDTLERMNQQRRYERASGSRVP